MIHWNDILPIVGIVATIVGGMFVSFWIAEYVCDVMDRIDG